MRVFAIVLNMNSHRAIILNGLQELSNASESGQDCQVTFEANDQEHWLQCSPTRIHMDWPFVSPPAENEQLKRCFGQGIQIDAWEADSFATFFPLNRDVESLIAGIDRAFQDLYGLGADYILTYKIENG